MTMMEENVTQKNTSERLNTSRSPEETKTHRNHENEWLTEVTLKDRCFPTQRSEEDSGGDYESEHQSDHGDASHD